MSLANITRESVLAAIAEFEHLGREQFLDRYGFKQARSYELEYDGSYYDSKAIVGAAHGFATGQPLVAAEFSGGAATVQRTLEALGFRVVTSATSEAGSVAPRKVGVLRDLTAADVERALREWRRLGRDAFMAQFNGSAAQRYVVITETEEADALALVLGARALAGLDTTGPWRGDRTNVAEPLAALGFRVDTADRPRPPEITALDTAVGVAAGRQTPASGQGFSVDQRTKVAVEDHAMALARRHYAQLGTVVETAGHRSWDYEVDIAGTVWHVEVKGTTGDPIEVILTPNEVAHAQAYEHVALYVVSNIDVVMGEGEERQTSGGRVTIFHPWRLEQGDLRPLGFKYRLPDVAIDLAPIEVT